MRISVVFPAPFSPTRPTISPPCSSSETSSTARVGPNDFETLAIDSRVIPSAARNTPPAGVLRCAQDDTGSELPARHLELPSADLLLDARDLGDRFRLHRRFQRFVPAQGDAPPFHAEPVDVRLELAIAH